MITILDYGSGNLLAIENIYKRLNINVNIVSDPNDLLTAKHIILPGVGSFDRAMGLLDASGMRDVLDDLVINKNIPVLGICVGMQMMAKKSEEGNLNGLGWIDGEVKKFEQTAFGSKVILPHMGWNDVYSEDDKGLFKHINHDMQFYFLHSYYFLPTQSEHVYGETEYSKKFASSIRLNNIFGVQFHPEKSHHFGIQLLKNFSEI